MSDALKGLAVVVVLAMIASGSRQYGFAQGLKAAPAYVAAQAQRADAESEDWSRLLDAVADDNTCRKIRDLVLADQVGSEMIGEALSPHND